MHTFARAAILSVVTAVCLAADPVEWKVVSVTDGDTVHAIDASNVKHKIRLVGSDAPETGQAFGTLARDRLATLAKGKTVTVDATGEEKRGLWTDPKQVPPWDWRTTEHDSKR